jgi:hypothetical protein
MLSGYAVKTFALPRREAQTRRTSKTINEHEKRAKMPFF